MNINQNSIRKVDLVIISDVHLGTYGCHANELVHYLRSIKPNTLVLNGDIIDGWAFSKSYFPAAHHQVLLEIMRHITGGCKVFYLTGNHDEMLRRFSDLNIGQFHLVDKLVLKLDGKRAWIFHGDVFDLSVNTGKWLARIGGKSYDYLIVLNRMINWVLMKMGKEKVSISKKIKASVKKAVSFVGDFEEIAANHAIEQGYDYVVCGHIHQAQKREITNEKGSVLYLNSGDWVESLTALEYNKGDWRIFFYDLELENILKDATQEIASNLPAELLLGFETSHIINTH
ncbi:MAG TPA: UDP-2,3-diacylglucosamine diphosphatase [Flavobacteriales bacterium]|nr:UDP-2,3-diacylglucosamine diphosphatase [Flavobacteriales bacterium]